MPPRSTPAALAVLLALYLAAPGLRAQAPNILHVILDDGNDYAWAGDHLPSDLPAFGRLAAEGTRYDACYAPSPVCCPSRVAFLSGKDPNWTGVADNQYVKFFRKHFGSRPVVTLMEHLREGGYYTVGINKVFHNFYRAQFDNDYDQAQPDPLLRERSWNEYLKFKDGNLSPLEVQEFPTTGYRWGRVADADEGKLADYRAVDGAIAVLQHYVSDPAAFGGRPLSLTVGLVKPHVPHQVPARYFPPQYEPNPLAATAVNYRTDANPGGWPLPAYGPGGADAVWSALPEPAQRMAWQSGRHQDAAEAWAAAASASSPLSAPELLGVLTANANMAYYASMRFADAQIGRLLDALDSLGLAANTVVIVHSDHGFSQGEHRHWAKNSLWETDGRVPLVIRDPRDPVARAVREPVSLLDLFPTVSALAGLAPPVVDGDPDYLDGRDIWPLRTGAPGTRAAHTVVEFNKDTTTDCTWGRAVYEAGWHLIEVPYNPDPGCAPDSAAPVHLLYHLDEDPGEWTNLAEDPAAAFIRQCLVSRLDDPRPQDRWRVRIGGALPDTVGLDEWLGLSAELRDPDGLPAAPPAGTDFIWQLDLIPWNAAGGASVNLNTGWLPEAAVLARGRFRVQLYWRVVSTGQVLAFDTRTFAVRPPAPRAGTWPSAEGLPCAAEGWHDLWGRPLAAPRPGAVSLDACGRAVWTPPGR